MGKVLGRGLEALIKTYNSDSQDIDQGYKLNINQIVPNKNQPRQKFNSKSMERLSIKLSATHGSDSYVDF